MKSFLWGDEKELAKTAIDFANSTAPIDHYEVYTQLRIIRRIEALGWAPKGGFKVIPNLGREETAEEMENARRWLRKELGRLATKRKRMPKVPKEVAASFWSSGELRSIEVERPRLKAWLKDVAVVGVALTDRRYRKSPSPRLTAAPMSVGAFCVYAACLFEWRYRRELYQCRYSKCVRRLFWSPKTDGRRDEYCSDECRDLYDRERKRK